MKEVLFYESSILAVSLLFAFLAWRLYGKEAVDFFGPDLLEDLNTKQLFDKRKKLGMLSEMLRAVVVAFICLIVYAVSLQPTTRDISLSVVFQAPWFQIPLLVASSLTIIWCVFLGPWKVMNKKAKGARFRDKNVWKYIRLPYLMWIPYIIGVYYLMGGFIVAVLVITARSDISILSELSSSVQSIQGTGIESFQLSTLELNRFGRHISSFSQKYILVSILAFIFVVIEQHSYMEKTQFLVSLNLMKIGVFLLLIGVLAISLGYLPYIYDDVHNDIQNGLDDLMGTLSVSEEISDTLTVLRETQEHIESHNLRWLFLNIITGFGNIISLAGIGGILLIRNVFFKEIPFRRMAELILPTFLIKAIDKIISTFGLKSSTEEVETAKPDGE